MRRLLGQDISPRMALACGVETLAVFAVILLTLGPMPPQTTLMGPLIASRADFAALLALIIAAIAVAIGVYRIDAGLRTASLLAPLALSAGIAFAAVLGISEIMLGGLSREYLVWLAGIVLAWALIVLGGRAMQHAMLRRAGQVRLVAVLGEGPRATRAAAAALSQKHLGLRVVGGAEAERIAADAPGTPAPWAVIVATEPGEGVPFDGLFARKLAGARVYTDHGFWERQLGRIDLDAAEPARLLFAENLAQTPLQHALRRALDIAVSATFLLLTAPVVLAVVLATRIDSPGPVLYRQERAGLGGRPFTLFKFRSMVVNAEAVGAPIWATSRDPRITRVGAFIRRTRIDEVPQMLNVLKGEMSVVGPRPERPIFVEQLARAIPLYGYRALVKPGITGWAQVNFPYGASVEDAREKLAYDLYYVRNRSIFLDVLILFATVRVILFRVGSR